MFSALTLRVPFSCIAGRSNCSIHRTLPKTQVKYRRATTAFARQPYHSSHRPAIRMSYREDVFALRRQTISRMYHNPAFDQTRSCNIILWSTIGASVAVFGAWRYGMSGSRQTITNGWIGKESTPQMVYKILSKNFLLTPNDLKAGKYWTLLTSAISHIDLNHLIGNMFSLHAFGSILIAAVRSPVHIATLFAGSALAGSFGFILQNSNSPFARRIHALGASGMVMGVGVAAAMLRPTYRILLFGLAPVPLWVLLPGYVAFDTLYLNNPQSRTGHAAHLGGAAFGAVFYALILRRFGGIFPLR